MFFPPSSKFQSYLEGYFSKHIEPKLENKGVSWKASVCVCVWEREGKKKKGRGLWGGGEAGWEAIGGEAGCTVLGAHDLGTLEGSKGSKRGR